MAAIGNLSEQAGFALKKIGLLWGSILFFRETDKEFPLKQGERERTPFLFFFIVKNFYGRVSILFS